MVVFDLLELPIMTCRCTLSRNYLQICFWGTDGVMNIV